MIRNTMSISLCLLSCTEQKSVEQAPIVQQNPIVSERIEYKVPDNYRYCTSSQDCVVVYTISGLTEPPQKDDTCTRKCTFGIAKHARKQWQKIREQISEVPCDMEMEPCPPKTNWTVQCIQNQCESVYKKQTP